MSMTPTRAAAFLLAATILGTSCGNAPDAADPVSTTEPLETFETGINDLDELLTRTMGLHNPCASLDEWTMQLVSSTAELNELAERLHGGELDAWRDDGDVRAASDTVLRIFTTGHNCDDLEGDVESARAAAAAAFGAVDAFHLRATNSSFPKLATRFWVTTDQLGSSIEADRRLTEAPIDVLIVGDSATMRGVDPQQLTASVGDIALNGGADGLLAEMLLPTIEEYQAIGVTPHTVVLGVNAASEYVSCDDLRPALQSAAMARRNAAFSGVEAIATLPGERRVHGGEQLAYASPLLDLYLSNRTSGELGAFTDGANQPDIERQLETASRVVGVAPLCPEHAAHLGSTVRALRTSGITVVVVFTPITDAVADLLPNNRVAIQVLLDAYRAEIAGTGAIEIDASEVLLPEDFFDLTHANDSGRRKVTALIASALLPE